MTVYDEYMLRDPGPDLLARRKIVSLSRFNDDDIRPMDYDSWRSTESRYQYDYDERKKIELLTEDIERNGLRKKIEIMRRGDALNVCDGHHRVVVLKALGWTHIPYRWFIPDVRSTWHGPRYQRHHLPLPSRENR